MVSDDILTRLREASIKLSVYGVDRKTMLEAADEIERLRRMAMMLIDELRQNGGYEAYTPEMLFQEFYEEARRGDR